MANYVVSYTVTEDCMYFTTGNNTMEVLAAAKPKLEETHRGRRVFVEYAKLQDALELANFEIRTACKKFNEDDSEFETHLRAGASKFFKGNEDVVVNLWKAEKALKALNAEKSSLVDIGRIESV